VFPRLSVEANVDCPAYLVDRSWEVLPWEVHLKAKPEILLSHTEQVGILQAQVHSHHRHLTVAYFCDCYDCDCKCSKVSGEEVLVLLFLGDNILSTRSMVAVCEGANETTVLLRSSK